MNFPMIFPSGNKYLLLLLFLLVNIFASAQEFPEIEERLVNDLANVLTPSQRQALENKLVSFDDSTTNQIEVIILPSLEEYTTYPIEEYGVRWAHAIGIGKDDNDNGVLLLIAMEEKEVTIQVGYGLEPVITDGRAGVIIRKDIAPAFREGNYYAGIDKATDELMALAIGEYNEARYKDNDPPFLWIFLPFIGMIILFIFLANYMKKKGYIEDYTGRGYKTRGPVWWGGFGGGGSSWGGGSGGFGGGGGFGGFGGGGFGGGGASGGW